MVDFNPQIGSGGVADFTSSSRGTGPNRTFEALFEGLTETVENTAVMQDRTTQRQIEEESNQIFDSVNEEFGVSAPPSGMQGELDRIVSLQNALEQGKISEVNYYGRLATLSRQLRQKYPRYERIVDATIQSVTGTRPANAYRDALFSELNAISQGASDESKFRRQYEKENEGIIAAVFGEDYFTSPEAYDFDQVRSQVSRFKARAEGIDAEMKELNLQVKRGEVNDRQVTRTMSRFFSFTTEAELNKAIGANGANFQDTLNSFMASGAQDLDSFTMQLGEVETRLRSALTSAGQQQFISTGLATQEDVNKAIDAAMFPINEAKKAVLGGNFQYAGRMATINKSITDRSLNEILRASPDAVVGAGLSELNSAFGENYMNQRQTQIELDIDTLAKETTGRVMRGEEGLMDSVIRSGDQKVSRAAVDETLSALRNSDLNDVRMSNVIDQMFGPNAIDFMSTSVVDASDLETVYMKFLDPRITENIRQNGSEEDFKKYAEWAYEKFLAIPAFRGVAGDFSTMMGYYPGATVRYDEGSKKIVVDLPEDVRRDSMFIARESQNFGRTVNALNKAISVLDPIFTADGVDTKEGVSRLLKDLSVNVSGPSDFFDQIEQAIQNPSGDGSSIQLQEEESLPTELDFMFQAPENLQDFSSDPQYMGALRTAATGPYSAGLDLEDGSTPLSLASKFIGMDENTNKATLSAFFRKAGGQTLDPSETAWCAAFVNSVLGAHGKGGTDSLAARSFLSYGEPVTTPSRGDIVVLRRGTQGWQGHVGFYVGEEGDNILVLGGNQSNKVSIDKYPKRRLLGYRRPHL